MHDIKIFLEDNGQFWASATLWKEKIYGLWNNYIELLQSLNKWVELSNSSRKNISEKTSRLSHFLQTDSQKYATQV